MRIGELAALVGVSVRAVRHYHRLGLLPEPARRANGYREYGLQDAVLLARVRRLTELGFALDEVRDALTDDTGRDLREILTGLDAGLARRQEALRDRRARIAVLLRQLDEGGLPAGGPLSPELNGLFARIVRDAPVPPDQEPAMAVWDREVLGLMETAAPGARETVLAMVGATVSGPEAVHRAYEAYAVLDALADASPGDPRVAEAAAAIAACVPGDVAASLAAEYHDPASDPLGTAFGAALLADLAPAQAAAVRQAVTLLTGTGGASRRDGTDEGREPS